MYEVDEIDKVVKLDSAPQCSIGAPIPTVLSGEHDLFFVYYLENTPDNWEGTSVRTVRSDSEEETVTIISFSRPYAHFFGPPNDEAFEGHPLSSRGLGPYSVFEIRNSSWLRKLEKMNAVHPEHIKESFLESKKHFIFSFHDTTFECIAEDFKIDIQKDSIHNILSLLSQRLS